eukprot:PhF_6_TR31152/c0_g1_i2/m.45642/K03022/RPC8, POLR3H; DNA-directed RNA polymerase III subunit RPC8
MFCLCEIEDVVRIAPEKFDASIDLQNTNTLDPSRGSTSTPRGHHHTPTSTAVAAFRGGPKSMSQTEAVIDALTNKYVGTIVSQCGLVISVWGIEKMGVSSIVPGDGGSWTNTTFILCCFRPMKGAILTGVIVRQDALGIDLSVGFFDNVYVPKDFLQPTSVFDTTRKCFVWNGGDKSEEGNGDDDDAKQESFSLFYRNDAVARCVVVDLSFMELMEETAAVSTNNKGNSGTTDRKGKWSMTIRASMADTGLGLEEWW